MQANSSTNISTLPPLLCYSNSLLYPYIFTCFDDTISSIIFTTFTFTNLLILPIYILVLWMGFQRWRHQSSGATSHSDVFIYHMVTVEIIGVLGTFFLFCAIYMCSVRIIMVGYYFFITTYPGQTLFHCLTCVERYLAVVYPITYMGLRKAGGVKVRNISIGCTWLVSLGLIGLTALYFPDFPSAIFFPIFAISVIVIYFCSFCVIYVLIRLGLGKVGGNRKRIDQSKQRAFHTIMAIMGTLVFRMIGLLIVNVLFQAEIGRNECVIAMSALWLCLPSSLVLPVLFLHRAGVLACHN